MIDQHLEKQGLSFFTDEVMHGFIHFDSVFYCIFSCLEKTGFWLIAVLFLCFLVEVVELPYGDALFFDTFFPNLQILIPLFLLFLPFFLFLLHPKDLHKLIETSASSGIAKGLSYFGIWLICGNLFWLAFLESSSKSLFLIKLYNINQVIS